MPPVLFQQFVDRDKACRVIFNADSPVALAVNLLGFANTDSVDTSFLRQNGNYSALNDLPYGICILVCVID